MTAKHEIPTSAAQYGAPSTASPTTASSRASWRTPHLRAIPAAGAEIGLNNHADGDFTQS